MGYAKMRHILIFKKYMTSQLFLSHKAWQHPQLTSLNRLRMTSQLKPSLYRIPTQNDGLKTFTHLEEVKEFAFYHEKKAMKPWLEHSLNDLIKTRRQARRRQRRPSEP